MQRMQCLTVFSSSIFYDFSKIQRLLCTYIQMLLHNDLTIYPSCFLSSSSELLHHFYSCIPPEKLQKQKVASMTEIVSSQLFQRQGASFSQQLTNCGPGCWVKYPAQSARYKITPCFIFCQVLQRISLLQVNSWDHSRRSALEWIVSVQCRGEQTAVSAAVDDQQSVSCALTVLRWYDVMDKSLMQIQWQECSVPCNPVKPSRLKHQSNGEIAWGFFLMVWCNMHFNSIGQCKSIHFIHQ